ncbi:hypothetical protein [Vreelandella maris]|uniref:hypothetical protein n=1 Tax=Vreelandella maris TaxID=2729617 RepID=UPI0030EBC018
MNNCYGHILIRRVLKCLLLAFPLSLILVITISSVSADDNSLIEKARITQYIEETRNLVSSDVDTVNASVIQQTGSNNNASIMQSYSASFQTGNFALIRQKGNENMGTISQHGGNNAAVIWQVGNNHIASVNQRNENATLALNADIRQFGIASDIHITQSGSGPRSISIEHQAYSGNALPVIVENH